MEGVTLEFLVPGLVPFGLITLLAGKAGDGKSTLAHELAIAAGTPQRSAQGPLSWLGVPLSSARADGIVAFVSGEDDAASLHARSLTLDPEGRAETLADFTADLASYRQILKQLGELPNLRLLVIDPARKFTEGSEDTSEAISNFFGELEKLAGRTGCAVVVVHHLGKNANPRSLGELRLAIRGSGVFTDRPRVVLGMYRQRDRTIVGVAKTNLPPASGMVEGRTIRLVRDTATLRHLPADQPAVQAPAPVAKAEAAPAAVSAVGEDATRMPPADALLETIRRLTAEGRTVTRTGRKSPYGWKPAELDGYPRSAVEGQLDELIAANLVRVEGGRLFV
jgi:hypothetical protein